MGTDWVLEALSRLNVRDEIEKKESSYFNAFLQLRHHLNERKLVEIDRDREASLNTDKEIMIDKMNGLYFTIEKLNEKLASANKTIKSLEKENQNQQARIESLMLEVNEKNRAIETVNDELLSLNIQNNVLGDNVKKLSAENEALVARWMERVKQDVEKLNEANEMINREV